MVQGQARVAALRLGDAWLGGAWLRDSRPGDSSLGPVDGPDPMRSTRWREALGAAWLHDAAMEHASAAAFALLARQLVALQAPPSLVAGAHRAASDEVRHACVCFSFAAEYRGEAAQPGGLSLSGLETPIDLESVALATVVEGCVGETLAAAVVARQAELCTDPMRKRALAMIASDEADHAEHAWRVVAWALVRAPELARLIHRAIANAVSTFAYAAPPDLTRDVLHAHGRLTHDELEEVVGSHQREVIAPLAAQLLSPALAA
jgi:hypothetical protein